MLQPGKFSGCSKASLRDASCEHKSHQHTLPWPGYLGQALEQDKQEPTSDTPSTVQRQPRWNDQDRLMAKALSAP